MHLFGADIMFLSFEHLLITITDQLLEFNKKVLYNLKRLRLLGLTEIFLSYLGKTCMERINA